jgi:hypothetical protein
LIKKETGALPSLSASASMPEQNGAVSALSDNAAASYWFSWHWCFPAVNIGNSPIKSIAVNIVVYLAVISYVGYRVRGSRIKTYYHAPSKHNLTVVRIKYAELGYKICYYESADCGNIVAGFCRDNNTQRKIF